MHLSKLVLVLCAVLLLTCPPQGIADDALLLGIHPYKAPSKLLSAFGPLADYLSDQLERPVKILISPDYQAHIQAIGEDRLDIAYMGPASYVKMTMQYPLKPLLAKQAINGKAHFRGAIVTHKDSRISALTQLTGKRFAFGDPTSTMSSLVPRSMLLQAGVQLKSSRFLGSHDNVALAVLSGDFDAGAVKEAVFNKYRPKGLKPVTYTPEISEHLFVAGNRLTPKQVERICTLMFDLDKTAPGRKIMQSIKPAMSALVPVEDADYQTLRDLMQSLEKNERTAE